MNETVVAVIFTIAIFVAAIAMATGCESVACENKARLMGLQSDYGVLTDCMVKTEKGWIPIENVKVLQ